jgi:hypothetical protein
LVLFLSDSFSFAFFGIWFYRIIYSKQIHKKNAANLQRQDKISDTFRQYHELLNEIENQEFTSEILKRNEIIKSEEKKHPQFFKEFSKILDTFDQRNNDVIITRQWFILFEVYNACKVEKWISNYKHTITEMV